MPSVLFCVGCSKTAMQHSPKELKQMGLSKFQEALISQIDLKRHYLHSRCHSIAHTHFTFELGSNSEDFCSIKGVNKVVSDRFWIFGLLEAWIMLDDL